MARAGKDFALAPAAVTVERFTLREYAPPEVAFEAVCSAGTYVRSLAHDLGQRLGCGAHLAALARTAVGPIGLAQAVALAALEDAAAKGDADRLIQPLEELLPWAPAITVRPEAESWVRSGRPLGPDQLAAPLPDLAGRERLARLFSADGRLLALARPTGDGAALHPFLVIA
jgi:tRNA pseudouridine55 synthase